MLSFAQQAERALLCRGRQRADTESLLYLLIEKGEEAIKTLRGQFSFVFLDKKNQNLLLCRDRVGQKPLFFSKHNNSFSFSSNLISLSKLTYQKSINETSIYRYLQFGKTLSPDTIFENIYEIKPGQTLSVKLSRNGFIS